MPDTLRVAAVQMEPAILRKDLNLRRLLELTETAARGGASLIVFPECALTGYCFSSLEEALPSGESIPGPATEAVARVCREMDAWVVFGLLERDGQRLFNAAVLVGPRGPLASYRKLHLPYLGVDRFATRGDRPLEVAQTPVGALGLHICYDCTFPEVARSLALLGAEVLVLPTNWPQGREHVPTHVVPTRALENRVNFIAVNRVGRERTFTFIGRSQIVDPLGNVLAQGSSDGEEVLYAELDLARARDKKLVIRPGEFETDAFKDRRPELYGAIAERALPQPAAARSKRP